MMEWINHAYYRAVQPPLGASVWPGGVGRAEGRGVMRLHLPSTYTCFHAISSGSGTLRINQDVHRLTRGHVFTMLPAVDYYVEDDPADPWEYQWVNVHGPEAVAFAKSCGFGYGQRLLHRVDDPEAILAPMRALHAFCQSGEAEAHPYQALALFFAVGEAFKTQLAEPDLATAPLSERAVEVIEASIHEAINVSDIARLLNVSRVTLYRAFRDELGTTPMSVLTQTRIRRAKQLLASTPHKIAVVARSSGFTSEKYFIRRFETETGLTPGAWRTQER